MRFVIACIYLLSSLAHAGPPVREINLMQMRVNQANAFFSHVKTSKGLADFLLKLEPKDPFFQRLAAHAPHTPLPRWSLNNKTGSLKISGLDYPIEIKKGIVYYRGKSVALKGKTFKEVVVAIAPVLFVEKKSKSAWLTLLPEAQAELKAPTQSDLQWFQTKPTESEVDKDLREVLDGTQSMLSTAVHVAIGAMVAGAGLAITGGTGGLGAVVGGTMAVIGAGIIVFTLMPTSAEAAEATPRALKCTQPAGGFQLTGSGPLSPSLSLSLSVDSRGQPQRVIAKGRGEPHECKVRAQTSVDEGWFWDSEVTKWNYGKCSKGGFKSESTDLLMEISNICKKLGPENMNTAADMAFGSSSPTSDPVDAVE